MSPPPAAATAHAEPRPSEAVLEFVRALARLAAAQHAQAEKAAPTDQGGRT